MFFSWRYAVPDLPTGVITLLFTDIEGSTRLWERFPDGMPDALARHDAIVRDAIEASGGTVFRTVGDAFCSAFPTAGGALNAALAAQRGLYAEPWERFFGQADPRLAQAPARIAARMALHTSAVELREGEYSGPPLNRVARLLAAGHGGQTLVCEDTATAVSDRLPAGVSLRDMGLHRLKDLRQPVRIFELLGDALPATFPPLKTLTVAGRSSPGVAVFHQPKLPGMPGVDYDTLWRREKEREQKRKKGKKKREEGGGLF
jgi:class 3 adenylate cyclase